MTPRERLSVWFEGPRRIGIRREELPPPPRERVQVRSRLALISTGTELAAWRGDLDPSLVRDESIEALGGSGFGFPFRYGYATLGEIEEVGAGVSPESVPEGPVFAFVPHETRFHAAPAGLLPVPPGIPDERAVRFPYCETAVNLLLDGPPRVGDRVVVIGQGMLGLALVALLARFPLGDLVAVDPLPERRALSAGLGARTVLAPEEIGTLARKHPNGADLVFEVSGSPAGLDAAIGLTARDGKLVAGSWLAGGKASLDLGGWFHRGRLRIVSSQVSHLPALGPAWSIGRRREVAWSLLAELPLEELPSFRVAFPDAATAYERLEAGEGLTATLVSSEDRASQS